MHAALILVASLTAAHVDVDNDSRAAAAVALALALDEPDSVPEPAPPMTPVVFPARPDLLYQGRMWSWDADRQRYQPRGEGWQFDDDSGEWWRYRSEPVGRYANAHLIPTVQPGAPMPQMMKTLQARQLTHASSSPMMQPMMMQPMMQGSMMGAGGHGTFRSRAAIRARPAPLLGGRRGGGGGCSS